MTALAWDQQGTDVYFAVASLQQPRIWDSNKGEEGGWRVRTKANIGNLRAIFLDLDVFKPHEIEGASPEKLAQKYTDRKEALDETKRFCAQLGWPLPMVVNSGWGFHLYWLLEESITPTAYEVLAKKLKIVAKHLKYKLDVACTDMSRVLRVANTHNHKQAADKKLVTVLRPMASRAVFSDLSDAVEQYLAEHRLASRDITERAQLPDYLNFGASNTSDYPDVPMHFDPIVQDCGAVREFVEQQGDVPYHYWLHALQLLRFCENGIELCHELSSGASSYDKDATDTILAGLIEKDIPPTLCDTFAMDSEACESCAYRGKVRSPASFGRDVKSFKENAELAMHAAILNNARALVGLLDAYTRPAE
jgi:hypothetical protein